MRNKILCFVGAFLLLCGALALGASAVYCDFSFDEMTGHPVERESYVFGEELSRIVISESRADVIVKESLTDEVKLSIVRDGRTSYLVNTYEAENGKVLSVSDVNSRKWYDYILNIELADFCVELELPRELMPELEIRGKNANVVVERIDCRGLAVYSENGFVSITDTDVEGELSVSSETSGVFLQRVSSSQKTQLRSNEGDLVLRNVEAMELGLSSVYGGVSMYTVGAEVVSAKSECGEIRFESCDFTRELELINIYGNVTGTLDGDLEEYSFNTLAAADNSLPTGYASGSRQVKIFAYNGSVRVSVDGIDAPDDLPDHDPDVPETKPFVTTDPHVDVGDADQPDSNEPEVDEPSVDNELSQLFSPL